MSHILIMSAIRRGIQSKIGNLQRNIFGSQCRWFWDYAPEPFHPIPDKFPQVMTAEEAVKHIQSDHIVFVQGSSATPNFLVDAMTGLVTVRRITEFPGLKMITPQLKPPLPPTVYTRHVKDLKFGR